MKQLTLSTDTLFYATRYALSRNTAAAMQVVNDIVRVAGQLNDHDREQLRKEIEVDLRLGGFSELNRDDWQRAIAALESAAPMQDDGKTPEQIELEALGMYVDRIGGPCPFQIEARIHGGGYLYFRARGSSWRLSLGKTYDSYWNDDEYIYSRSEPWGMSLFTAGYMTAADAVRIISRLWPEVNAALEGAA